jgi:carboxyl-terminal processing protease
VGQGKDGPLTDVIGWRLDDVVQLIRGKGGTAVRLQVLPAGAAPGTAEKTLEYLRNKVTLEAQAARKEIKTIKRGDQELKVGVINVPASIPGLRGAARRQTPTTAAPRATCAA